MKNIAVIGCGRWGSNLIRDFNSLGVLHTICDEDEDRLFSQQLPSDILLCLKDYKPILRDPAVQGVVIATPSDTHYRIAKEALLSGKDVFVEKPMALSVGEGTELVSIAQDNERILLVGHLLEYHPAVVELKKMVDRGTLGRIHYISSTRLDFGNVQQGSDVLWTFAPHDLDTILLLLGRMPRSVSVHAGDYLQDGVADVAYTVLEFDDGLKALLFLSWLYPHKERKMVIIGDEGMAVYDDVGKDKLTFYPDVVRWESGRAVTEMADGQIVRVRNKEPLRLECEDFIHCIKSRQQPRVSLSRALQALELLVACQSSLKTGSKIEIERIEYYAHPTATLDAGCRIGEGTKIWHYSHISSTAVIGKNCTLGQNVYIGPNVKIGDGVRIQNNVSVYEGVTLEDNVFCGPSCVFTNDKYPRADRQGEWLPTLVKKGASIGANATIICGVTIGENAMVGAGTLVSKDVPTGRIVYGNPAKVQIRND